jgi:lysophospholipase L1-like esterase
VHPEKLLASLPGACSLSSNDAAALYDLVPADYQRLRSAFRAAVSIAARETLAAPGMEGHLAQLPFDQGDVIIAVGDSITDDYQSWLYILEEIVVLAGAPSVSFVNAGVSGDTTANVLARLQAVAAAQPDWLLLMVGTNDACTHGPLPTKTAVSADESRANLGAIARFAQHLVGNRVVWLTPPPVLPDRVRVAPALLEQKIGLEPSELHKRVEFVRSMAGTVVDVCTAFGPHPDPGLYLDDGVHPSLAGQQLIAKELIQTLGTRPAGGEEAEPDGADMCPR